MPVQKNYDMNVINEDLELLTDIGVYYKEEQLQGITKNVENQLVYELSFGKYTNEISIDRLTDKTEITYQQDDITNVVTICENGDLLVDGVFVTNTVEQKAARRRSYTAWTQTPGYGTSSSYKYLHHTDQCSNVQLTKDVRDLTIGVFTNILEAVTGLDIWGDLGDLLTFVYEQLVYKNPTTDAISYKAPVYTTQSGTGLVNNTVGYCYKYVFTFYANINYNQSVGTQTWYQQIFPYA